MRLSYNDFKIRKLVEENRKTLFICMHVCVCVCFCQYMKLYFYHILYNLSFIKITLKKIPKTIIASMGGPSKLATNDPSRISLRQATSN